MFEFVTPAKAGVQSALALRYWIPALAGMTATFYFIGQEQYSILPAGNRAPRPAGRSPSDSRFFRHFFAGEKLLSLPARRYGPCLQDA